MSELRTLKRIFLEPFVIPKLQLTFAIPFSATSHIIPINPVQLTKKRKQVNPKVPLGKTYSLQDASSLLKDVNTTKFDASVDMHIRLGIDPRKADQAIRGVAILPHGTGKTKRVL